MKQGQDTAKPVYERLPGPRSVFSIHTGRWIVLLGLQAIINSVRLTETASGKLLKAR